jgi:formylglycine-generating enzyme required for sulfatase activity
MLSQTLVTQELWESVMVDNPSPSRFKGTNRPVENVSWEECKAFIDKLNDEMREKLGVPPGYEFALPLERQWEHACRAGTSTPFHVGLVLDAEQANIGKLIGETSEVGKYPANPWGLYDMHGNVWEGCYDGLGYGPLFVQGRESVADGFYRSLRGGSWSLAAEQSRSAYRSSGNPKMINDITGKMLRAEMRPTRDGDIEKMVGASMVRGEGDIGFRLCLVAVQPLTFP